MKPHAVLAALVGGALLIATGAATAQAVYRSVDRNGKVVFSDQAPTAGSAPDGAAGGNVSSVAGGAQLPYELRQVVQRYPVTIYTGDECAACAAGRSLLTTRGIPFTERTVRSPDDVNALQRLTGQASLPLLTIGQQQLKGFSDTEWSQYLDAAGYPASVQLPPGYRNAPAQPLVAVQPAVAPATAAAAAPPAPVFDNAPNSDPTPSNPAGIKF